MSNFTLEKLNEMIAQVKALPPMPQIFVTSLISGGEALQRGSRTYISPGAAEEIKVACSRNSARPWHMTEGMPTFSGIEIQDADQMLRTRAHDNKTLAIITMDLWAIAQHLYEDEAATKMRAYMKFIGAHTARISENTGTTQSEPESPSTLP